MQVGTVKDTKCRGILGDQAMRREREREEMQEERRYTDLERGAVYSIFTCIFTHNRCFRGITSPCYPHKKGDGDGRRGLGDMAKEGEKGQI